MSSPSAGRSRPGFDIWPGFVDALATLLMVIIFVLLVFVLSQFYLSAALSGRDEALGRLNRQISELAQMLSIEKETSAELRLNIAQLAAELSIGERYLIALEDDRHSALPGDVYVRQWLRQLSAMLGLVGHNLAERWAAERSRATGQPAAAPEATARTRSALASRLRLSLLCLVALAALAFFGSRLYAVVSAPPLTLSTLTDETTTVDEYSATVAGETTPEATVAVNGQLLTADRQGKFSYTVSLRPGLNVITVTARKRHSFVTTIERTLVAPSATLPSPSAP